MSMPEQRIEGPRADLVRVLQDQAEGWWHLAKDRLYAATNAGAARLEAGDLSVHVGHTLYVVMED